MTSEATMLIIPAIDIKDGKVVRLYRGEYGKVKVYSQSPVAVANIWVKQGAKLLHIVDLDGALSGKLKNLKAIKQIAESVDIPIEVGGGIRTIEAVRDLLDNGVHRVILGTRACMDEAFLQKTVQEFGERIMVSIDTRAGMVATDGWTKVTKVSAADFLKRLELLGLKVVIFTAIERDGTLEGPDVEALKEVLAARDSCLVIASGGISTLDDLLVLKNLEAEGLFGAIVGKALYEKKIDLEEAINMC